MEQKVVKKVIVQNPGQKESGNSGTFLKVLNILVALMVFIIFVRGFNIKGTVKSETDRTIVELKAEVKNLKTELETDRQIDKNEILSAFALYSRLDQATLKEKEEYHAKQQSKYENMAKEFNKGLNEISKEIKGGKTSK